MPEKIIRSHAHGRRTGREVVRVDVYKYVIEMKKEVLSQKAVLKFNFIILGILFN